MHTLSYKKRWTDACGFRLQVPDPREVEENYRISAENNAWTPFPYWTRLWPAAYAMTKYLGEHHSWLEGRTVIEWGAGIGLPSFAAAQWAARVTLTDHIEEAMEWARLNVAHLGLTNVETKVANFTQSVYPEAEVVILSDVSYDPESFETLRQLIDHYLVLGSRVIIAIPERIISGKFYEMIEKDIVHSGTYQIEDKLVAVCSLLREPVNQNV